MNKAEFDKTDKPLVMICSLNPETGKVLFDTYDWETADLWVKDFENDFPEMLHFRLMNPAGIKARKEALGLTNHKNKTP